MNTLLTKHVETEDGKTRAQSIAAYMQAWENSRYLLRPLFLMLKEQQEATRTVKEEDFTLFNHYGKIMFNRGKEVQAKQLLDLMPKSLDK